MNAVTTKKPRRKAASATTTTTVIRPEDLLAGHGQNFRVGGNEPFRLDNSACLWLVLEGAAEVFLAQKASGRTTESRYYLCTVSPGQLMFGMTPDEQGLGLLAVGLPDTALVKLEIAEIRALLVNPEISSFICAQLENWLGKLADNLTEDSLTTPTQALLKPGESATLERQQRAGTAGHGGCWVRLPRQRLLFMGEEVLEGSTETLFPCFGNTWVQALDLCILDSFETLTALEQEAGWHGLELFASVFFSSKQTSIRLNTYDEINRLRKRAENEIVTRQNAVASLTGVLEKNKAISTSSENSPQDALLITCRLIGEKMGLEIIPPARPLEDLPEVLELRLLEITRASRLRTRKARLDSVAKWWEKDNGPMLGIMKANPANKKEREPVALLPVKGGKGYVLAAGNGNPPIKVTREIAAGLEGEAFYFYRPFPATALDGWELLRFGLRDCRQDLIRVLALSVLIGIMSLVVPLFTRYLFQTVIPSARYFELAQILVALVVVALAVVTFQLARGSNSLRLETRLTVSLQTAVWDRLLNLEVPFFRQYSSGDLASRAMAISQIRSLISSNVFQAALGLVSASVSFALMFYYSVGLALLVLGLVIVTLLFTLGINLWQLRYQRALTEKQGKLSGLMLQMISGIAKLRVAGAEIRAFANWAEQFSAQRKLAGKARSVASLLMVFNAVWPLLALMSIFVGVAAFQLNDIGLGVFLSFLAAYIQVLAATLIMAAALTFGVQAIPVYQRARCIFEAIPEVTESKLNPGELSGAIEINHVAFRYSPESPLVLKDVSLKIKPGEFVAIVGPSGAGKSSLLRLLLGFESPASGSIYFDNQDLAGLDIQAVRRQIGTVIQNGKLIPGTIFTNIVGNGGFSQEEAWEAARMVGVEQDIRDMPMGMSTVLSESASTLSGGQRQRILIARAIISRPRVILFDEATSALDNHTQTIVSESLENLQATRIVIAHRLSTIVNADCIYVIEDGRVAQSGTYHELLNQVGPFRELARRQLA